MKLKSWLFLFVLIIIIVFILGVRYGQKVEQTNKVINYLVSLPPTKPPPTAFPINFKTYQNKVCGIRFLIPSTINIEDQSSDSAKFNENGEKIFQFNCQKGVKLEEEEKTATPSVTFRNKKVFGKKDNNKAVFIINNPANGKKIYINTRLSFFPLLEKSLEFIYQ